MTIEEILKNAEFELWNHIIIMENCPKVVLIELRDAHMHIRKAMDILGIEFRR